MKAPPALSGARLRALVAVAESPLTSAAIVAVMTRQMGIDALAAIDCDNEPAPVDERPVPYAGRAGDDR